MSDTSVIDPETDDWLTLDQDEEIIWSGKLHESSLIPALIIGLPLALVLVGLFIIAGAYLHRENTQYVVTTDGLYKKTGILSRDVQRIDFGKVQNTSYSQGFFGSQFGYGNVDISTAGGSGIEMQFQSVPEPREVQELINKRVKASRGKSTESSETKRDVLDEILIELKEIHSTLEAQQETVGDTSATLSNIGNSEKRHSTSENDSELNESEGTEQATEASETDQGSNR
ncbi:PH domain-containing protein [Natronorubrum aibiense]|uniref:PH domain-containing protein n=1 Tax=Natronorubrum aibiense TaxID=348826 RepID=A0A5P9P109_9EURY|nr:PH domain-containing protein [Natronorubrum aibiense]QFU81777.1 PH domain-containing protein [Natronorubrum aibiense]